MRRDEGEAARPDGVGDAVPRRLEGEEGVDGGDAGDPLQQRDDLLGEPPERALRPPALGGDEEVGLQRLRDPVDDGGAEGADHDRDGDHHRDPHREGRHGDGRPREAPGEVRAGDPRLDAEEADGEPVGVPRDRRDGEGGEERDAGDDEEDRREAEEGKAADGPGTRGEGGEEEEERRRRSRAASRPFAARPRRSRAGASTAGSTWAASRAGARAERIEVRRPGEEGDGEGPRLEGERRGGLGEVEVRRRPADGGERRLRHPGPEDEAEEAPEDAEGGAFREEDEEDGARRGSERADRPDVGPAPAGPRWRACCRRSRSRRGAR